MRVHTAMPSLMYGMVASVAPRTAEPKPRLLRPLVLTGIPFELEAPIGQGSASVSRNVLTLTASRETNLHASANGRQITDSAPRVLFEPSGDFVFSTKLTADLGKEADGGALVVYADGANWAKLLFERRADGGRALSSTVTRGAGDGVLHEAVEGDSVRLMIARQNGLFAFYASADGSNSRMLRSFAFPAHEEVKIGFLAQSPFGARATVRFSEARCKAGAFVPAAEKNA